MTATVPSNSDFTHSRPASGAAGIRETLILTRGDIAGLMTPGDYLDGVEQGFRALGIGRTISPSPLHLVLPTGGVHAKAALLTDAGLAAVKVNANLPRNPVLYGLPTIQGAIMLIDAENGCLLAIMDSIEITLQRTAAATALAARHLALPGASRLCLIGCGAQAGPQIQALLNVLPIRELRLWDLNAEQARRLAADLGSHSELAVRIEHHLDAAVKDADVIVTCTTARQPFLTGSHIAPGAFIAAVGADSPEKNEISPKLMGMSKVVVDVLQQCAIMGDLRHAVAAGAMTTAGVHAELAQLVLGEKPGRKSAEDIFIFDSTGTAIQDVAVAATVYARAKAAGTGRTVQLGG